MPPMPRPSAAPPTHRSAPEPAPDIIATMPNVIASIGMYVSICWSASPGTSGISGGGSRTISPRGSSGPSLRSLCRTMTVFTARLSCLAQARATAARSRSASSRKRSIPVGATRILLPTTCPRERHEGRAGGTHMSTSSASGADTCRVTVVGPRRRVALALPARIPFAELFPAVADYAGLDADAVRAAPAGWVLQRLGQAPFPLETTPLQAGLHDGELIYLRPREEQLPELAFDDVADVIASGIGERPDRWGPRETRRTALGAAALALTGGAAGLLLSGPPWTDAAVAAGIVTVLLLAGAAAASRVAGDAGAATVVGYLALPY